MNNLAAISRPGIDHGVDPENVGCLKCKTPDGCEKHNRFQCENCGYLWSRSVGCADDLPNMCSDCWAASHCYRPSIVNAALDAEGSRT